VTDQPTPRAPEPLRRLVRTLHPSTALGDGLVCATCRDDEPWPCPTLLALDNSGPPPAPEPTAPDDREPRPCPRCGEVCTYDGWDHVHPNGLGIGSCRPVAPDNLQRDIENALHHYDYIDGTPGTTRDCQGAAAAVMDVLRQRGVVKP